MIGPLTILTTKVPGDLYRKELRYVLDLPHHITRNFETPNTERLALIQTQCFIDAIFPCRVISRKDLKDE